jgi:SAM-dependent methyltransferase
MMYGVLGKLKDYSKARVGNSSSLFAWVSEIAPEIAITHAIDVGCAQGNASVAIAQNHPRARVLALDTDPNSATFIRKKISAQRDFNVGGETLRGPGRITPVTGTLGQALASGDCQPGSQDFVMADAVIPYMEDAALRTFLADCHTVLKEGGLVAIGGYGHLHGFDKKTGNEDQIHCRSDVDLARMLQGLGFTVLAASNKLESQGGATLEQRLDGAELDSATDWRETLPEGVDAGVNYWHSVKVLAWKNSSAIDDALAGRFAPV